jgi:hypothetical protein
MRCKRVSSLPSRSALIGLLTGSAALAAASLAQVRAAAAAATETVLYKFKGGNDGANPHAGLISDSTGALYGTTWHGGGTGCVGGLGCGTVFKLTPPAAAASGRRAIGLAAFYGAEQRASPAGRTGFRPYGRALWHDIRWREYTGSGAIRRRQAAE